MTVDFTGSYSQTFDTLATTGTTNTILPIGWVITEAGGGARDNEQYAADDGLSSTGDTYSYGAVGNADRALGGLQSGTLIPLFGASFTNTTGNPITALTMSYTGEQWRLGTLGRVDRLDVQYSLDATSLTDGTWTDVDALDFVAPLTSGTVGAVDGNASASRTAITSTLTGLAIPNGATFWFRWQDLNASGADDGLAIDDFSLSIPASSTFTVTNTNDSGPGSLRDAILSANADPNTADTITFDGIFSDGTLDVISLTTDQLSIAGSVTINASGLDGITLSSNGNRRVLNIQSGTVVLNTLTLADGNVTGQGGGIFNNGTLSLLNSTIQNNSASDDGAGILNNGSLTITNSTLRNNTAGDDGGGIRNNATLTLINSTVSGNTATGASATSGGGGLLNVIGGTATLTNSTLSGNTAPNGGGIRNDGTLTLQNVTITANVGTSNGGGVLNTVDPNTFTNLGLTTLSNSIIAGNTDATTTPSNFPDVAGGISSFTDGGHNLIGAIDGFNSAVSPTTQSGTAASSLDPRLGPLANNGGPTQTHALLPGSPAIDQATTGTPTDQRGVAANGTRDIGAFEATNGPVNRVYVSPTFTGTLGSAIADADLGTAGNQTAVQGVDAFSTLAEALAAVSSDGTIIVNGGSYAETIDLTDTRTLDITGVDVAQAVTINALSTVVGTALNLAGSSTLTLGDGTDRTLAGTISGTGNWVKQGAGILTVSGANTYTGSTTVTAGTLQATANNALGTTAGTTTVVSGATLELRDVNYTTPETVILQGGAIANLAFGTTTTFAGDIILAADSNFDHNLSTLVLTGAVTGNFLLNNRSSGTLRLTNTGNSFSRFNIAAGMIQLGASEVILDTADMQQNSSTFDLNGFDETLDSLFGSGGIVNSQATLATLTIGAGNNNATSLFNGGVSGAINVVKTGTGRQVWGAGGSDYSGTTTINGGILAVSTEVGGGAIQALGSTAGATIVNAGGTLEFRNVAYALAEAVTLNGGTIRSQTGSSSFAGAITLTDDSAINGAGSLTLTGAIGEAGGARALTFNEAGTRTLTGTNTYTGATTINGGTLVVNGSLAAGSAVTVNNTGILTGDGAVNGAVTIASGGTLRPGTTIGDLATGSLTFAGGSTLAIDITGAIPITQYDRLNVTGSVNLGNATLALVGGYAPGPNESFTLIANDGADAVIGTFNGLAQGAVVVLNGTSLVVNYSGGDGNDVTLTNLPTVNLSVSSNAGTEAGTTVITVTATASAAVAGNQTVSLGVSGTGITPGDYTLSNGGVITILGGQTTGSITFTVVDDALVEGTETATLTISNPSAGITLGSTTSQAITLTDNDTAGVIITQSNGTTTIAEGGATDSYSLVLSAQPTANVTITLNSGTQTSTNPTSLVFTPANWNVAQTVTVTAVDDAVAEGNHSGTITHSASSADANYNGLTIPSVIANITDNDTAGVIITQSNGTTAITEGGVTDSYSLVLSAQPTANITIIINSGTQTSTSPTSLVFTPANWNVAQTVTVTAVDDAVAEGNHSGTITHSASSADANYNGLTIPSVIANITDNDTAGVIITQSNGTTAITEGGVTDSYSLVLSAQPTANVTITLNSGTQTSTNPTSFVFTPANWNVAQTVTVTAVDDAVTEGNHSGTITHAATSSDTNYNGIAVDPVNVLITDNDTPPTTANASVALDEDTIHTFSSSNFPFADADMGDTLQGIRITQLPTAGQLFLDANDDGIQDVGEAVIVGQDIDVKTLDQLKFRPVANANGAPYTSFQFQVSDGQFLSTTPGTLTLNVSPVNDLPTGNVTLSGITQATYILTADTAAVQDIDGLGSFSYQWQQSTDGTTWNNIAAATGSTFRLTAGQIGQQVRAQVSYTDGGGTAEVVESSATAAIRPFPIIPSFNGDDQADIAWRHRTAGRTSLWYMDGTSLVSGELLSRDAGNIWELKAVDDFDRDGSTDLVWQNPNNNQAVIWLMDGNDLREGILLPSDGMAAPQRDPNWQIVATGDFNGDNQADLLWRHRTSGENAVWFMNGTTRTGGVMLDRLANLDWEVGAVDDFNKNGEMEILWRHRVSGQNVVWYMDGTTRTGGEFIEAAASAWRMAGAADFNGDGNLDIMYRHRTTASSVVWFMDGLTRTGGTLLDPVAVDWQPVI